MFTEFIRRKVVQGERSINRQPWGGFYVNVLPETTNTIDGLDELLTNMFGSAAPPKEEILRHKWLESEKAGRDIGVLAAAYDWRGEDYTYLEKDHKTRRGGRAGRRGGR